jgi:hypothetical protein
METAIWTGIITGLGGAVAAFIGAWFLFRGKRVDQEIEETKVEASATDAFLKGQTAFQGYVDSVVEKRVLAAVAGMQAELAELQQSMSDMRRESHEMNDAIRARETQLWLWNIRNRPGPMPTLPLPILVRLGITHLSAEPDLEDTEPST